MKTRAYLIYFVHDCSTLIKILYFSGNQHSFHNSPRIKSHYDRGQKLFHLLAGEGCFRTGETVSANLLTGEATGAHLTGALGLGVLTINKNFTSQHHEISEFIHFL